MRKGVIDHCLELIQDLTESKLGELPLWRLVALCLVASAMIHLVHPIKNVGTQDDWNRTDLVLGVAAARAVWSRRTTIWGE
jgi:hypothetical protein